ncbi:MAG: hypothetical protein U9P44_03600 [archaeon]|nr:hypothetical protein [archaeon]
MAEDVFDLGISYYLDSQYDEIDKITCVIRGRLDLAYGQKESGNLDVGLKELACDAGCEPDFDIPDKMVRISKRFGGYIPSETSYALFRISDSFLLLFMPVESAEAFLREKIVDNGLECPDSLYSCLVASLYERVLEKFFGDDLKPE